LTAHPSKLSRVQVLRTASDVTSARASCVAIGVFDGVHRGHRAILEETVAYAREHDLAATVVTFDPHPARVLAPEHAPLQIETLQRRLERFGLLGIDQVRVINFDEAASQQSAEHFVDVVLVGELHCRHVVVGDDFRFGRDRGGNVERLTQWAAERGFSVSAVAPVGDGERFSSTVARSLLQKGDLVGAEAVLGHHFVVSSTVIHGDARGATQLGFPTANLALSAQFVQPGDGVYAGAARRANGDWFAAAISVGRRPQFYEHGELTLEVFLLDFSGDLYGEMLDVVFIEHLRDDQRFDSVADLVSQMGRDVDQSREIYSKFSLNPESLLGFTLVQRR
jgi:riboflavin kinase/FMN adenylyltransferase